LLVHPFSPTVDQSNAPLPVKTAGLRGQFKLAGATKQALGKKIIKAFTNQALAW
jgi:hypothetical protein